RLLPGGDRRGDRHGPGLRHRPRLPAGARTMAGAELRERRSLPGDDPGPSRPPLRALRHEGGAAGMTSTTRTGETPAPARGTARLAGRSQTLRSGTRRGRVPRSAQRGRPRLYTSYDADSALLNTPARRWWTLAALLLALVAPFLLTRDQQEGGERPPAPGRDRKSNV